MGNGAVALVWSPRLLEARELHRSGQFDVARAAYVDVLGSEPGNANALGLIGVLEMQAGQLDEAESALRKAVAAGGEPRIHLRNLNNLLAVLQQTGQFSQAREAVATGLPDWPEGAVPDEAERQTVLSLCRALLLLGEAEAARELLERALPPSSRRPGHQFAGDAEALALSGEILLAIGDHASAAETLAMADDAGEPVLRTIMALSIACERLGQSEAAKTAADRAVRRWPVYEAARLGSHRAAVLVLNPFPRKISNLASGHHGLHFSSNFPAQLARSLRKEFQFQSVFADLPPDEVLQSLPQADVAVNNIADPETMNVPGQLDRVIDIVERAGAPVINRPRAVFETTRQKAVALLDGIPNLKVPRIERYRTDLTPVAEVAKDIGERFAFPVIIRQCKGHNSTMLQRSASRRVAVLAENANDLREHLATCGWPEIYAVEYVQLRKKSGLFRKIRAVLAEDEVIVAIPGFASEWMVDGGRWRQDRVEFYRTHPEATEECRRIVREPERFLGADCLRTLEAIRDRMPLDLFGVDFEVDDAGQVVLFEANAAMNLLKRDHEPEDVTLPTEPFERVMAAFRRAVGRRMGEVVTLG